MMIYLGGPIDLAKNVDRNIRSEMAERLSHCGFSVYNPAGAFKLPSSADMTRSDAQKVMSINKAAMFSCDHVIFMLDDSTPTMGTPMEMLMAYNKGMSSVVLWLGPKDKVPTYVNAVSDCVTFDVDSTIEAINK